VRLTHVDLADPIGRDAGDVCDGPDEVARRRTVAAPNAEEYPHGALWAGRRFGGRRHCR